MSENKTNIESDELLKAIVKKHIDDLFNDEQFMAKIRMGKYSSWVIRFDRVDLFEMLRAIGYIDMYTIDVCKFLYIKFHRLSTTQMSSDWKTPFWLAKLDQNTLFGLIWHICGISVRWYDKYKLIEQHVYCQEAIHQLLKFIKGEQATYMLAGKIYNMQIISI